MVHTQNVLHGLVYQGQVIKIIFSTKTKSTIVFYTVEHHCDTMPFTYSTKGGCCSNKLKTDDPSGLDPACDGTNWKARSEPDICCPSQSFKEHSTCQQEEQDCKDYPKPCK